MNSKNRARLPLLVGLLLAILLFYLFAEEVLRHLLLYLSRAPWARRLVTGFPPTWYVASRFVAGEEADDAIRVARELNAEGIRATLDYLGESVSDVEEAGAARDEILRLLGRIDQSGIKAGVSVKLSQLGLNIDPSLALNNMRQILQQARAYDIFVRIDMEESDIVDKTLEIYRTLRDEGLLNTGVVIQSYLYRSDDDSRQLVDDGDHVRLVKGAYAEPPDVAYPKKSDVDEAFVRQMKMLMSEKAREHGVYLAIATHDEAIIEEARDYASKHQIPRDTFEFQMLYGIRRGLQEELEDEGYRVRVYIPYGTAWYPYLMRRLAERPANLWFFLANFFRH